MADPDCNTLRQLVPFEIFGFFGIQLGNFENPSKFASNKLVLYFWCASEDAEDFRLKAAEAVFKRLSIPGGRPLSRRKNGTICSS